MKWGLHFHYKKKTEVSIYCQDHDEHLNGWFFFECSTWLCCISQSKSNAPKVSLKRKSSEMLPGRWFWGTELLQLCKHSRCVYTLLDLISLSVYSQDPWTPVGSILCDCSFVHLYWKWSSVWAKSVTFELVWSGVAWRVKHSGPNPPHIPLSALVNNHAYCLCVPASTTRVYSAWPKPTINKPYKRRTARETNARAPKLTKGECRISHVHLMCDFTQFQAWLAQ